MRKIEENTKEITAVSVDFYVIKNHVHFRGAPEQVFLVPAGTGSDRNWKKVPAGTRTNLLSHI